MAWKGDPHAFHDDVSAEISSLTEKTSPVDADLVIINDSADGNSVKSAQLGNLPGGGGGGANASYAETIGDGAATSYQVTHSLDTQDLVVQLWDLTGAEPIEATGDATQIEIDDDDNITVTFGSAPATDSYRVVIVASGGSGTVDEVDDYLRGRQSDETTHTDDDFFDSTGLSAWTSIAISGSSSFTEKYGVASGSYSGQSADDVAGLLKPITSASAPMTIETAFSWANPKAGFNSIGLIFTDGTTDTDNAAVVRRLRDGDERLFKSAGTLTNYNSAVNVNITATDFVFGGRFYMRLIWSATDTFKSQFSIDGITWDDFGLGSWTRTMSPTHFGLFVSAQGSAGTSLAMFRYFRVYDADTSV